MPNIVWSDELSLGIDMIDRQHKMLIRLCNHLLIAIRRGKSHSELQALFHELSEYTVYHFSAEEKFMEELKYPKLKEHRESHVILKREVRAYQNRLFHQEEINPDEVLAFMRKWLIEHILGEDRAIGRYHHRDDHLKKNDDMVH
ncbi:bacteriohemerythrin [Desulfovibrio mangrovi]|uniref:bacteriohemerythrin n=1 Tax=Desulfovibrio mangrovi TaxID=2976983 RepID=UPI0022484E87|nr:bacteriohemerythrin [Desulfovibrio mangrovi]UZP66576.1 bacteriohemerythrin [Desulfovibrio mangrovi]